MSCARISARESYVMHFLLQWCSGWCPAQTGKDVGVVISTRCRNIQVRAGRV
jgi:hypothetical protein